MRMARGWCWVALGWSLLASVMLAVALRPSTITSCTEGGACTTVHETVLRHEGASVLVLLLVPIALCAAARFVAQRDDARAWLLLIAAAFSVCCLVATLSLGVFYLPAAAALWAAAAHRRTRRT